MQGPSEKNIIPIFSKKKKPRQALYAFPNPGAQSTGGAPPNSAPYGQQSFSGSNHAGNGRTDGWQGTNSTSHQSSGDGRAGVWQAGANRPTNQRTNTTLNKPRTTSIPNVPYQPSNQLIPNQGPQQAGNMKRPLTPSNWQQKYDEHSQVKASRPSVSPAPYSDNYQYAHRNNIQEPQVQQFPLVRQPAMNQSTMHQPTMHQPSMYQQTTHRPAMNQPTTHQQTMHRPAMHQPSIDQPPMHQQTMDRPAMNQQSMRQTAVSSVRQRPDLPQTPASHPARGSIGNALSPFRMPSTPQMPLRQSQPGTAAWEMKNPESAGCTVDKSMKMLTVSIEELRYWTVSRDIKGLLFFELFGVLNSAVCSNETGVGKKFTLKDGNHTLQCIFYETDRPLGPLTRGQCLRCVGNILPKEGVFRCVSVRPATLAEQKVMRSMVAACDRGVRERLSATGIEP